MLRENSKLLNSFWIHLNLLNEILLPGKGQKPIIKEETFSKTWYQKRSAKCIHKVTDLEKKRHYASIKIAQLEQDLILLKQTKPLDKKQIVVSTVTTKTANQPKPFPTSQKPPGTTLSQLAIALDIVIISIINTVIVFFCYCYYCHFVES